jgi:hypothetical protein
MPVRTFPNLELRGGYSINESGWGNDMNTNLLVLSAVTQGTVVDKVNTTPTLSSPAVYIFGSSHPTQVNKIAIFENTTWIYVSPKNGWRFYNQAQSYYEVFDGFNWVRDISTAASSTDIWVGTSEVKIVTPDALFDASVEQVLSDGATITINGNLGINFSLTLGGNRTLANPINMKAGQSGIIIITQDGAGSRTLSYGSNWLFPGGSASNTLSAGANKIDIISYFVRTDGKIIANLSKDYAV